jgi:Leucine-rich repeat (LRR) protein
LIQNRLLLVGFAVVALGCGEGSPGVGEVSALLPSELCSLHSDSAIPSFADASLAEAVRASLGVGSVNDLTCGLVEGLDALDASNSGVMSLVGIQNLQGLTDLRIWGNSIGDIGPLSGLVNLTQLSLTRNSISDIGPLAGLNNLDTLGLGENLIADISPLAALSSLDLLNLHANSLTSVGTLSASITTLTLWDNGLTDISGLEPLVALTAVSIENNPNLSDIQPLLDNLGLGAGDRVWLSATGVSCGDVSALEAKGVMVMSDCP